MTRKRSAIEYIFNDGGRTTAGFDGETGDCVTRSVAIVTGVPYREVYKNLYRLAQEYAANNDDRVARATRRARFSRTSACLSLKNDSNTAAARANMYVIGELSHREKSPMISACTEFSRRP